MLTALGLIGLSILGHAQDRLKQKEEQLKKAEKLMKKIEDATTIERIVIHTCIGRQIITKPPGKPNRTQQLHQRIFIVEK